MAESYYTLKAAIADGKKFDAMTPGRFEDAARDLCKTYGDSDPNLFHMLIIGLMEQALISSGYEVGCLILEKGMLDVESSYAVRMIK